LVVPLVQNTLTSSSVGFPLPSVLEIPPLPLKKQFSPPTPTAYHVSQTAFASSEVLPHLLMAVVTV